MNHAEDCVLLYPDIPSISADCVEFTLAGGTPRYLIDPPVLMQSETIDPLTFHFQAGREVCADFGVEGFVNADEAVLGLVDFCAPR